MALHTGMLTRKASTPSVPLVQLYDTALESAAVRYGTLTPSSSVLWLNPSTGFPDHKRMTETEEIPA